MGSIYSEKELRSFYNFLISLKIQLEAADLPSAADIKCLNDANAALKKIELGSFGLCDECGDPLPYGRLKMHPEKLLCLECQPAEIHEFDLEGL